VLLLAGILISGCSDTRISLDRLMELEREQAGRQKNVEVTPEVASKEQAKLSLTELTRYKVGPHDVLSIAMYGVTQRVNEGIADPYAPALIQARVHPDGTISVPLVPRIPVAGLELAAVEEAIIKAHVPTFFKEGQFTVHVEVAAPDTTTVVAIGAAGAGGPVKLPSNQRNLLYATAMAGGFSPGGPGKVKVLPMRPELDEEVYDLAQPEGLRNALTRPPLESGDIVTVEAAIPNTIYITGLVFSPGPHVFPPNTNISLLQAIASAGGLLVDLDPREATLRRTLPDGTQVRVKLELDKHMQGMVADIGLKPGDMLEVPHTLGTRFLDWFNKNIYVRAGASVNYDAISFEQARRALNQNSNNNSLTQSFQDSLIFSAQNLISAPPLVTPVP
jgi:protein involved in polysaccharide export with SLBB domain